jgi:transposase-like protein
VAARRREPPPPDGPTGDPARDALALAQREAEFNWSQPLPARSWDRTQTVLSPQVEQAILEALRAGYFRSDAATHGGVDPRTLRTWMRKGRTGDPVYSEFARRALAAELEGKDKLVCKVKAGALEDWRAAAWLLEQRWKAQFAARVKVIHATIKEERELMLEVAAELLGDRFDDFADKLDARLAEKKEASEEILEAEFDES